MTEVLEVSHCPCPIATVLGSDDLIRLTQEQIAVLDSLESSRRMAIEGAAGTGKTVLA